MRCGVGWPLFVAGALLIAPAQRALAAGQECAECHSDVVDRFGLTAHGKAFAQDPAQAGATCSSCHGGAAAHAAGDGDATLVVNPGKAAAGDVNALCLECHVNHASQTAWSGSAHETAGLSCTSCHDVHGDGMAAAGNSLREGTTERCLECHGRLRKSLNQRSTHPLRTGQMDCASCHNPHGGTNEKMIDADSVNDLCFSCHQEKRGPFLWEHSPVREDCLTCHQAHGSNHEMLLVARPVQLCQSCHLQGRHQTVAGMNTSMWNNNRQCLQCHSAIHGSNHPSGPLFQR